MLTSFSGLLADRRRGGPEHPDSGFNSFGSGPQLRERAEEGSLPGIPTQEPIDQPTAGADNLTRQSQEGVDEGLEFHAQEGLLFAPVTLDVASRSCRRPRSEER